MLIREITTTDKPAYQALVHNAYQSVLDLGIHFAAATADSNLIETHIKTNLVYGLFIEHDLVCSLSLRLPWGNNPGPYGVPHIGWFATDPAYKKQGLATKLLNWVEKNILLDQLKTPFVTLGTAANHPWLTDFYTKQGFTEIGRADLSDDHTTIYYRKVLNPELFELWQKYHPNKNFMTIN